MRDQATGWEPARVLRVRQETKKDRTIWLDVERDAPGGLVYQAGQHLLLRVSGADRELAYAISGAPGTAPPLRITVRHAGAISRPVYDLAQGAALAVSGPHGRGYLRQGDLGRRLVLAAAGSGIAPLRALVEDLRLRGHREEVVLLHAVRSLDEALFAKEMEGWAKEAEWFSYRIALTEKPPPAEWRGLTGRPTQRLLASMIEDPLETVLCASGPPGFVRALIRAGKAIGIPASRRRGDGG